MPHSVSFFYTTVPDQKTAEKLSLLLIEKKLAACTNIIPGMTSIYKWKGKIQSEKECVLIIKSGTAKRSAIEILFEAHHPYDTFCLAEISLKNLNRKYKNWLADSL